MKLGALYEELRALASEAEPAEGVGPGALALSLTLPAALSALETASPAGLDLLMLSSFMHPDRIPLRVFRSESDASPLALRAASESPGAFNDAVTAVTCLGLARRLGNTIFVHRLVQAGARAWIVERRGGDEAEWSDRCFRLVAQSFPEPDRYVTPEPELSRAYTELEPHAARLVATRDDVLAGELLQKLGWYDRAEARFTESAERFRQSASIYRRLLIEEDPDDTRLDGLAWALHGEGVARSEYEDQAPLHREEIALRRCLLEAKPDDPSRRLYLSWALNSLGDAERLSGNLDTAEGNYGEALAIKRALYDELPEDLDRQRELYWSLFRMGKVFSDRGDLPRAGPFIEEARRLAESLVEKEPDRLAWLATLADARQLFAQYLSDSGRPSEAADEHVRAHVLLSAIVARNPDNVTLTLSLFENGLLAAAALDDAGRTDEAAAALERTEEQIRDTLARRPSHGGVKAWLSNVHILRGRWNMNAGESAAAVDRFREAVAVAEDIVAPGEDAEVWGKHLGFSLDWLSEGLEREGRLEEAAAASRRALEVGARWVDRERPSVSDLQDQAIRFSTLARIRRGASRLAEALASWQGAVACARRAVRLEPSEEIRSNLVWYLYEAGRCLGDQGRGGEALSVYAEALVEGQGLTDDRAFRAVLHYNIGVQEGGSGATESAIAHLEASLTVYENTHQRDAPADPDDSSVAHVLRALIPLLESRGDQRAAAARRARLDALRDA